MASGDGSSRSSSPSERPVPFDENESKYMDLIQHRIQPFFPSFAAALSGQSTSERESGRCAVVELDPEAAGRPILFRSSEALRHYLSSTPSSPGRDPEVRLRRRLFILEDLPRNYVSALGSHLRTPPSFFAGHYDDPATSTFNHRNPFEPQTAGQFRLRYSDSHRAEVDALPHERSSIYAYNTNVFRYLHVYDSNGPLYDEIRSSHILSFWSSPFKKGKGWDAILLVDPPLGSHAKCLRSNKLLPVRRQLRDEASMPRHYLYPEMSPLQELPVDSSTWAAIHQPPQFISIFDDALNKFPSDINSAQELEHPRAAIELPRKLVIGTMLSFLRRRYLNLLRLQKTHVKPNQTLRINYLANFTEGALSKWHEKYFNFIIGSCAAMKELIREVEDNMTSSGIAVRFRAVHDLDAAATPPQWETNGWQSVLELAHVVDGLLTTLAAGYMQYITVQEARVSSATAQSLSKITVLTMLFIPLSTIASIFSMSDDYLPGKPRAWVFWVVSFPFLLSLAYLYWRQHLVEVIAKKKQKVAQFLDARGKSIDVSFA